MQAVVGDGAFDAASADLETGLAEFLGDDIGGSLRIKKAVANDLPHDFVAATVVALGPAFLAEQPRRPELGVGGTELEVALFAEAVLLRRGHGTESFALAFDKHEQFAGDLVVGQHLQGPSRTNQLLQIGIEAKHTCLLQQGEMGEPYRVKYRESGAKV